MAQRSAVDLTSVSQRAGSNEAPIAAPPMHSSPVAISVVIPTRRGVAKLPNLAAALQPHLLSGDEVIVVDDASDDGTPAVAVSLGLRVVALDTNGGVGRARNAGVRAAKNSVICFFDDDVVPVPEYLDTVRRVFADERVQCAQGAHALDPADAGADRWQRADALIWRHYEATALVSDGRCAEYYSGATCVRRETFLAAGGFTEVYRGAGGEEFELAARLLAITDICYVPELVSYHHYKRLPERLRTLYRRARNFPAIAARAAKTAGVAGRPSHVWEGVRSATACGTLLSVIAAPFVDGAAMVAVAGVVGFVALDWRLYRDCVRWRRIELIPNILMMRSLQYVVMSCGALAGMSKHAR